MPESRRDHYRLIYPLAERPRLVIGTSAFDVVECSERGLRFAVGDRRPPAVGSAIEGRLMFRRGVELEVVGEIARSHAGVMAVLLHRPGIPFAVILQEQQYLRSRGYAITE